MEHEIDTLEDIQLFVSDLHLLFEQCLIEELENKVIRKVDRKKTSKNKPIQKECHRNATT